VNTPGGLHTSTKKAVQSFRLDGYNITMKTINQSNFLKALVDIRLDKIVPSGFFDGHSVL